MMRARICFALTVLVFSFAAHAQPSMVVACSQVKSGYQCDQAAFAKTLSGARAIAIETQPFDRNGERELAELAAQLGKATSAEKADLVFRLERIDPDHSLYYGPNSRELATLRVYFRSSQNAHGPLIWIETFTGQPDMPWPTVVHEIIEQFKADTK
jgi:hypothetical protein